MDNLPKLGKHDGEEENDNDNPIFFVAWINTVPEGRIWGIIYQVCYWGETAVLDRLLELYPTLDLELETNEEQAPQRPLDIAVGHTALAAARVAHPTPTSRSCCCNDNSNLQSDGTE